MRRKLFALAALLAALWFWASLANPPRGAYMATLAGQPTRTVWVGSNGWHTGIIVDMQAIPAGMLPQKAGFATERYLEMGWGDAGFYQAQEITTTLALDALLRPTPSAVHLAGFSAEPAAYFRHSEVLRLRVSEQGFHRLLRFMEASIGPMPSPAITRTEGLYGNSRFRAGVGEYSALRTCNHWAAEALREAGVPVTPWYAATSAALMWQLRRYAE